MERHQRAAAAAFIRDGRKVLIAKRSMKCKVSPGKYELPGGKIEFGETPEQALRREIKEELGVSVKVMEPYHAFSYVCHDGKAHHVEIAFLCELNESKENVKMLEHDDIQWVTREELSRFEMSRIVREAIERGFELISRPANRPS